MHHTGTHNSFFLSIIAHFPVFQDERYNTLYITCFVCAGSFEGETDKSIFWNSVCLRCVLLGSCFTYALAGTVSKWKGDQQGAKLRLCWSLLWRRFWSLNCHKKWEVCVWKRFFMHSSYHRLLSSPKKFPFFI